MKKPNKNQLREINRLNKDECFERDGFRATYSRNGASVVLTGRGPEDYIEVPVAFLRDALEANGNR